MWPPSLYTVFPIGEFMNIYANLMHISTPFKTIQNKLCPLGPHQRQPHGASRKHGNADKSRAEKLTKRGISLKGHFGVFWLLQHMQQMTQ